MVNYLAISQTVLNIGCSKSNDQRISEKYDARINIPVSLSFDIGRRLKHELHWCFPDCRYGSRPIRFLLRGAAATFVAKILVQAMRRGHE